MARRGLSLTARRALFLAAASAAVFGASVFFGFIRWDDPDYTFRCAFVAGGFSWANLCAAFSRVAANGIWMPLTNLAYMLDVSLFGPGPAGHHAVNVALHAANAVLLWQLLRRCFRGDGRREIACLAAALFWAVHPQRAEAVCWVAARKELLWTFFALLGLLAWQGGRRGRAAICCACACMSKPTAICFPLLVAALDFSEMAAAKKRIGAPWYAPLFAMAAATGALAIYSQTHAEGFAARALFEASFAWRALNALVATGLYAAQTILPFGVHADYRALPGALPQHAALGLVALAALVVALVCALWRAWRARDAGGDWRAIAAVAFAALAALAPTLGVFGSFGESARADRFWYAPSMAFSFALAALLARGLKTDDAIGTIASAELAPSAGGAAGKSARAGRAATWALLTAYAIVGAAVAASWRNDLALFSRVLAFDSEHGRALAHVASERCRLADSAVRAGAAGADAFDAGIALFRKSLALRPRDNVAAELAYALAARGYASDAAEVRRLAEPLARDPARDRSGVARAALARLPRR